MRSIGRTRLARPSVTYGELAEAASRLTVPKDVPLKEAKDFRLLGKSPRRIDGPAI
jgi:isoquinoline 1-oxidoreductase beta subunit